MACPPTTSHNDGSGVCYCSYRRPIANLRPKYRTPGVAGPWQFAADLSIVAWLEAMKYDYDVITDEDLHRDGVAALKPYRAVLNGTHNEYYSERMMDATEDYLAEGGRLLNLGANTHYWCVGFRDDEPWVMEVRKLEAGSRAWQARPGEHYLASTGERSGLWRHRGRPPQKLIGVGFTSEGMDSSVPYRRMPDSYHRSVAWIFRRHRGRGVRRFRPRARRSCRQRDRPLRPRARHAAARAHPGLVGAVHRQLSAGAGGDLLHDAGPRRHPAPLGARPTSSISPRPATARCSRPARSPGAARCPARNFQNPVSRLTKNIVDAFLAPGPLPGS